MSETAPRQETETPLRVHIELTADGAVVSLTGELDLASSPLLEQALHDLEQAGCKRVVVDLREVYFMDSTGLRTLLIAHKRAVQSDIAFCLRRGPHQVQRLFELTRSIETFDFLD
jgi:anti-anti-sigma factor